MSLNQWMMPTKNSACGSGKNDTITGTMIVDVPKPVSVPTALAKKVKRAIRAISTSARTGQPGDRSCVHQGATAGEGRQYFSRVSTTSSRPGNAIDDRP